MKQTPLIPRDIAEWIEYCKSCSITFYGALDPVDKFGMSITETFNGDALKCAKWARSKSNKFAYAWVNGYEIDEKYYYVAIPIEHGHYRRLIVLSSGIVALGDHNYESLELLKKHSRQASDQLTEKMIKDSPLSWAWQFARELEL
jgi:hypothetical protein